MMRNRVSNPQSIRCLADIRSLSEHNNSSYFPFEEVEESSMSLKLHKIFSHSTCRKQASIFRHFEPKTPPAIYQLPTIKNKINQYLCVFTYQFLKLCFPKISKTSPFHHHNSSNYHYEEKETNPDEDCSFYRGKENIYVYAPNSSKRQSRKEKGKKICTFHQNNYENNYMARTNRQDRFYKTEEVYSSRENSISNLSSNENGYLESIYQLLQKPQFQLIQQQLQKDQSLRQRSQILNNLSQITIKNIIGQYLNQLKQQQKKQNIIKQYCIILNSFKKYPLILDIFCRLFKTLWYLSIDDPETLNQIIEMQEEETAEEDQQRIKEIKELVKNYLWDFLTAYFDVQIVCDFIMQDDGKWYSKDSMVMMTEFIGTGDKILDTNLTGSSTKIYLLDTSQKKTNSSYSQNKTSPIKIPYPESQSQYEEQGSDIRKISDIFIKKQSDNAQNKVIISNIEINSDEQQSLSQHYPPCYKKKQYKIGEQLSNKSDKVLQIEQMLSERKMTNNFSKFLTAKCDEQSIYVKSTHDSQLNTNHHFVDAKVCKSHYQSTFSKFQKQESYELKQESVLLDKKQVKQKYQYKFSYDKFSRIDEQINKIQDVFREDLKSIPSQAFVKKRNNENGIKERQIDLGFLKPYTVEESTWKVSSSPFFGFNNNNNNHKNNIIHHEIEEISQNGKTRPQTMKNKQQQNYYRYSEVNNKPESQSSKYSQRCNTQRNNTDKQTSIQRIMNKFGKFVQTPTVKSPTLNKWVSKNITKQFTNSFVKKAMVDPFAEQIQARKTRLRNIRTSAFTIIR